MESGVHSSFYPNCHHQIVFAKFNLKIFHPPILTLLIDQSMSFLGKTNFPIHMQIKTCIYLMKQFSHSTFSLAIYHTRQYCL